MSENVNKYDFVVLDSTFFYEKFDEAFINLLTKSKVFVSDTFESECIMLSRLLPPSYREIFLYNYSIILSKIRFQKLSNSNSVLVQDCMELLNYFSSHSFNCLIVTGNRNLTEKIIFNKMNIDIFYCKTKKYILHKNYPKVRHLFDICQSDNSDKIVTFKVDTDTYLYTKNDANEGGSFSSGVILGRLINSGSEANVFAIKGNSDYVVKVFKGDAFDKYKLDQIQKHCSNPFLRQIDWALFPIKVVYYDDACLQPAGFLEKFFNKTTPLAENPLYLGDLNAIDVKSDKRIKNTLDKCIQIVSQVSLLGFLGFCVSDFNIRNFDEIIDDENHIQMWDTDSFGYQTYFSPWTSGNVMTRKYDLTQKSEVLDFCTENLYEFIFTLLSLGDYPLNQDRQFKYSNPNYGGCFRKEFIPNNLFNLFNVAFSTGTFPSTEVLLYELLEAKKIYENDYSLNVNYYDKLISLGIISNSSENNQMFPSKIITVVLIVLFILGIIIMAIEGTVLGRYLAVIPNDLFNIIPNLRLLL